MTLSAGEDQSADPKDYFGVQPGTSALFTSGTKLFVAIKNVRFGNDDQSLPYATDECGHPSGKNDSAPVNDGGVSAGNNKKDAEDLKPNDANQQVNAAVAPVQIATPLPVANAASSNANSQQTQAYINRAQNTNNDAIQNALALSQAKINAMKSGGATPAQQQEIQQAQQQQTDANNAAVETSLNNLASAFVNVFKKPENQPTPSQPTEEKKEDVPVDQTVPDYADPNSSSYDEVKAFFTTHTAINTSEVPTYAEDNARQGKFKVAYRLYYSMIQYPGDYSQQQMQSADRAVASYYQKGTGVEANADSARKYYLAAGDNDAANNVSNYTVPETPKTEEDADAGMSAEDKYLKAKHLDEDEKSHDEALKWYKNAANSGNIKAMIKLSLYYDAGDANDNQIESFKWAKMASEAGDGQSMVWLARKYIYGWGVDRNLSEGINWYQRGANVGNSDACYWLGLAYYKGEMVKKNFQEASKFFKKCAESNSPYNSECMYDLGTCYENGRGVLKNKVEALKWYTMALNAGFAPAANAIKILNDPPANKVVHKRKKS